MKIKENYVMREVAGQAIVIAIGKESERFKGMINLNQTGKDVWMYLEEGLDIPGIVNKFIEKYEIDESTASEDVTDMINRLYKAGVLEK